MNKHLSIACFALAFVFALEGGTNIAYAVEDTVKKNAVPVKPAKVSSRIKTIVKTCFACHGKNGISSIPTRPTIAGQKSAYIVKQLKAFRRAAMVAKTQRAPETVVETPAPDVKPANAAGNKNKKPIDGRNDPVMDHFSTTTSNDDLGAMALYISNLSCKAKGAAAAKKTANAPPPMPVPDISRRCAACHGNNGVSSQSRVPNLAGQQRGYLRRELLLLRESAWGNKADHAESWRTHPIMEKQVGRLRIDDVDTLAYYYAQLDCAGL